MFRRITQDEFARSVFAAESPDRRFAIFIGAGCSVSSGIPAARTLVATVWIPRLQQLRGASALDSTTWATQNIEGYDPEDPAASYGDVLEQLFLSDRDRQAEIERLCSGKWPRFGYATLAALMTRKDGAFSMVLTTNFDDLLSDALYLFTEERPLVVPHAALASFIQTTRTRPSIVKLHGDNRLAPMNLKVETDELRQEVASRVRGLLEERGLIFVGYGGRDQGVRKMLDDLPTQALGYGVYWVGGVPGPAIRPWLESRNAVLVDSNDFDELMIQVFAAADLTRPTDKRFRRAFERYDADYVRLHELIEAKSTTQPGTAELRDAISKIDSSLPVWFNLHMEANRLARTNPERAEPTYARAIDAMPEHLPLLFDYTEFVTTVCHDYDRAERMYRRAVELDPGNVNGALRRYATFLETYRQDPDRAEKIYKRAVAEPYPEAALVEYARFLANVRHDSKRAEDMYQRAVQASSGGEWALVSYGKYLARTGQDLDRAEEMFKQALGDWPESWCLIAYANFLAATRHDLDRAEELHGRAIKEEGRYWRYGIERPDAESLWSYARFLHDFRKDDDRADMMYKRAIEVRPADPDLLADYAVFLQVARQDAQQAQDLYGRAIRLDVMHANALANLGGLLLGLGGRDSDAVGYVKRALVADVPQSPISAECWFYLYANGPVESRDHARDQLETLLDGGVRSRGWSVSANVDRARSERHPEVERVERLGAALTS